MDGSVGAAVVDGEVVGGRSVTLPVVAECGMPSGRSRVKFVLILLELKFADVLGVVVVDGVDGVDWSAVALPPQNSRNFLNASSVVNPL